MSLRIVFMGTPEFAVASLQRLHESPHEVAGVVTVADKPAGRGRKLRPSAVKSYALEHNLPLLQPTKLREPEFLEALSAMNADIFVVVAFRMLPEAVWSMPSKGTINLHGSLLPEYRGAAPIHWAVINGETKTGCTTFFIDEKIDTGAILLKHEMPVGLNETTGEVHDRMMEEGADLLLETVDRIEKDNISPTPQKASKTSKHAPKLSRDDGRVDWEKSDQEVHNLIRGMSPFPGAWTTLEGETMKLFRSVISEKDVGNTDPGSIRQSENRLFVATGKGHWIELLEIQPQGKKRMDVSAFTLGNNLDGNKFD